MKIHTGEGWMIKIRVSDENELNELLSADEYEGEIS